MDISGGYKTQAGNYLSIISRSHMLVAVASNRDQVTVILAGTSLHSVESILLPCIHVRPGGFPIMLRQGPLSLSPFGFRDRVSLVPGGMCSSHPDVSDTSSSLWIGLSPIPRIGRDLIHP